jgi:hypothetical protein
MTDEQEIVTAAVLVVACLVALRMMQRMSRGMVLPQTFFRVATWWRVIKWTAGLTAVASIGALAASSGDLFGAIVSVGGGAILLEALIMSYAKTWGPKE